MSKSIFGEASKKGFLIAEILMAIIVLSFIIHPVFVESYNNRGEKITRLQWELPMAKMLSQITDLEGLIKASWAGLDRQFGYKGGMPANTGKLMRETLQNGIVLMTAGFVDKNGRISTGITGDIDEGDISTNVANFDAAAKGFISAFYDAAREGMAHQY
jgi:hypothetical protein